MGYTIFVEARTKAEANELGFKLLKKCKQSSNYRIAIGDNPKTGLCYIGSKKGNRLVGFDYSTLEDNERHYLLGIIKWLAGMVGCEYYYYDGEKIDILKG